MKNILLFLSRMCNKIKWHNLIFTVALFGFGFGFGLERISLGFIVPCGFVLLLMTVSRIKGKPK